MPTPSKSGLSALVLVVCAFATACKQPVPPPSAPASDPAASSASAPAPGSAAPGAPAAWGPPPAPGAGAPGTAAESAPAPAEPFDPAHPAAAGMSWVVPAGFVFRAPASSMRLAEYVVGRSADTDVTMTVFHFPGMGGGIDANIQRWTGQFTQPDGRSTLAVAHIGSTMIGPLRVTTVDVTGHFEGGAMGGGTGDDFRLLGAIAEAARGPVFFKLVGPRAVIDTQEASFRALVASFAVVP